MFNFQEIVTEPQFSNAWEEEHGIMLITMRGDFTDQSYRNFWTRSMESVLKHGASKMLVDQREIGKVSFTSRAWVLASIFPTLRRKLSSEFAVAAISSPEVLNRTGIQFLAKAYRRTTGLRVEFHDSLEEAALWLNHTVSDRGRTGS